MILARYDKSSIPWQRRTGIYGHLPKYYRCKGQAETVLPPEIRCAKPTRHLSYPGYLRLITPHTLWTWWYWGRHSRRFQKSPRYPLGRT